MRKTYLITLLLCCFSALLNGAVSPFSFSSLKMEEGLSQLSVLKIHQDKSGFMWFATSNRKSACIALFLNKLYLYYDVSPLNKVFTTLHRSTQFCVLGSISACKGRYLFGIINISKNFFCIYC